MQDAANETYEMIRSVLDEALAALTAYGLDVVAAIAILLVGIWAAGKTERVISAALTRTKRVDAMLVSFFANAGRYLVLVVVGVAVLNRFGIETTSLIAVLGAAGLAIGLALQGTLSNVAAGVMLLIFRPFHEGDYVDAGGHSGTVKSLNLFFTVMATPDNVKIIVPNSDIWGSSLRNYSIHPERRVDLVFGIAYDADIDQAMNSIKAVIAGDERIHDDPEPFIAVTELGDSSVNIVVRVWADNGDYWPVRFDLMKGVKERLDAENISIPFPTRTIHVLND